MSGKPLKNAKNEAFVQYLHEGKSAHEAYVLAGYKENRHNAAKLARKEHIVTRLNELHERQQRRHDVTVDSLTGMLFDVYEDSRNEGDRTNARQACNDLAKLHGLSVDKIESKNAHTVSVKKVEWVTTPKPERSA